MNKDSAAKAQTQTSGFLTQKDSLTIEPVDPKVTQSAHKPIKAQKLNDVAEEQLEDSGPNTNRQEETLKKMMHNSVSHQQLVKALSFGLQTAG